jgi:Xaa-Pro aminopeptidase
MEAAVLGVTEAEVAAEAIAGVVRAGGALYGLGLFSGPWAHTFSASTPAPYGRRGLVAGDMIRLDLYGSFEGYLFDFGRSRVVGRVSTQEQAGDPRRLRLRPPSWPIAGDDGRNVGAQSQARLGAPWIESACSTVIRPGMCFAIERRIETSDLGGANYENDVIVTDAGPEIVTPAPDRYGE